MAQLTGIPYQTLSQGGPGSNAGKDGATIYVQI